MNVGMGWKDEIEGEENLVGRYFLIRDGRVAHVLLVITALAILTEGKWPSFSPFLDSNLLHSDAATAAEEVDAGNEQGL